MEKRIDQDLCPVNKDFIYMCAVYNRVKRDVLCGEKG